MASAQSDGNNPVKRQAFHFGSWLGLDYIVQHAICTCATCTETFTRACLPALGFAAMKMLTLSEDAAWKDQ